MLPAVCHVPARVRSGPGLAWPIAHLPTQTHSTILPSIHHSYLLINPIPSLSLPNQHRNPLTTHLKLVHASVPSNTFALYGHGEEKELTELVPGILNQLGPDSLASLRKLAESYQNMQKAQGEKKDDDEEDDIPDLVEGENFESKVE